MQTALLISLGGVAGALARFYLGLAVLQRMGVGFPYGTLLINVAGCFVIGVLGTLATERAALVTREVWLLLGVGFCGAFTTFSSFGLETLSLLRAGALLQAGAYVMASNALGLLAVCLGFLLARNWV